MIGRSLVSFQCHCFVACLCWGVIGLSFGFDHLGPVGHGVGQNLGTGEAIFDVVIGLHPE